MTQQEIKSGVSGILERLGFPSERAARTAKDFVDPMFEKPAKGDEGERRAEQRMEDAKE